MAKKQKLTKENYPPAKTARRPKKFGSGYLPVMQQSEADVQVIVPHAGEQRPGAPGGHGDWGPPDETVNALPDLDFERQQLLDAGVPLENVDRIYPLEGDASEGEEPVVTPEEAPTVPEEAAVKPVAEEETSSSWWEDIGNLYIKALVSTPETRDIDEGALAGLMKALHQAVKLLPWGDQINRWGHEINVLSGTEVYPDPQTTAGKVTSDMVQIGLGILPAIKFFKILGISNRVVSGTLGGGLGDFVTSDTEMARGVVSALKLIPSKDAEEFSNLINTWLDDSTDERELEARLVNMGFGIPLGLAAEGFLKIFAKLGGLAKQGGDETVKAFRETVDSTLGVEPRRGLIDPATDPAFREAGEKATVDEVSAFLQTADEVAYEVATAQVGQRIVRGPVRPRKGESLTSYIYRHTVDRMAPLSRLTKLLREGTALPAHLDPWKLARIGVASSSRANMFLEYGVRNFNTDEVVGKSLKAVLKDVNSNLKLFEEYIVARRAVELFDRGIKTGVPIDAARKTVSTHKGKKFDDVFKELVVYQDNVTKYLMDSGVISRELYKKIREANKDYVPFYRLMDDDSVGGVSSGAPIKALTKEGSERAIHNPLESIIKNTYMYVELAHRNSVGTALVDLSRRTELGMRLVQKVPPVLKPIRVASGDAVEELITTVPNAEELLKKVGITLTDEEMLLFRSASMPLRSDQIRIFRNGKAEIYQVDEHIAKIVQGHTSESINLLTKIMRPPARLLRAGAILDPAFFLKNAMRDNVTAFIYSTSGYKPLVDYASGFVSMIRKDKHWQDWMNNGGTMATLSSLDRVYLQKNLQQLTNTTGLMARASNVVSSPLEALRIMSDLAENSTRVGEFKRAVDKLGGSTRRPSKAALTEAAFRSREITLDFARMGSSIRALNMVIPFLNARIQGWDRMARGFMDHPVQFNAKAMASISAPSIYLWYANHDQPRYQELPSWQKDLFWIFCADWDDPDAVIWRIPKPFELGIIYGTFVEHILDAAYEVEGFDIEELASNMWGSIATDTAAGWMPTAGTIPLEMITNHDFFRDKAVVSSSDEKLPAHLQYGPHTSPTAIAVGELLSKHLGITGAVASPKHIENSVANLTGTLGRYFLQGLDLLLETAGLLPDRIVPSKKWHRGPWIKSFTIRFPSLQAASIDKFFENYKRIEKIKNGYDLLQESGKVEEAAAFMRERQGSLAELGKVKDAISTAMRGIKSFQISKTMSAEEKSVEIDKLIFRIIDIAQMGNELVDQFEKRANQDNEIFDNEIFD
jgi:hypothetical protein